MQALASAIEAGAPCWRYFSTLRRTLLAETPKARMMSICRQAP